MAKSNINDDVQKVASALEQMVNEIPKRVGQATEQAISEGIPKGIEKGKKSIKQTSIDIAEHIVVEDEQVVEKVSKSTAQGVKKGLQKGSKNVKPITIKPVFKIDSEDVNYAKINSELDKILKKVQKGTNKISDDRRYLDILKTSDDIGNTVAKKYLDYRSIAQNAAKGYSPKNIIQEFVAGSKLIEQQNQIWGKAIELLQVYQSEAAEAAKANRNVLPYRGNDSSILIDGFDLTKKSGYKNVTQKSLKNQLKDYLEAPTQINFDVLAAYTNALGDMQKAEEIFGKKHSELFERVVDYINQARVSTDAYRNSELTLKAALNGLGVESITLGKFDEFKDILSNQGLQQGVEWLEKELGIELPKAAREAFELNVIEEWVNGVKNAGKDVSEVAEKETSNLKEEKQQAKETTAALEELNKARQWVRGETGGANAHDDSYTVATSKFSDVRVRNSIDKEGNAQTAVSAYVNMDKLAKEILKLDTQILNIEYQIKHAQGDTSGLEENLGILKQQRAEYEAFLDDKIADPYYETNESQKEILLQQRAINEELIRNEQYTKDAAQQEKERLRLLQAQKQLTDKKISQQKADSEARRTEEAKNKQQTLNKLVTEQEQAYRNIYDIKKAIAKLDPTKNASEIQELERQKQIQVDIYAQKSKAIKAIDEQVHKEAHLNQLSDIREKSLREIARLSSQAKDRGDLASSKSQIKEDTEHNEAAAKSYRNLIKDAQRYFDLRKLEAMENLSGQEKLELEDLRKGWNKATLGVEEYQTAVNGSAHSKKILEQTRLEFEKIDSVIATNVSTNLKTMASEMNNIANSTKYMSGIRSEADSVAESIKEINEHPIDVNSEKVVEDLAKIQAAYDEVVGKAKTADEKLAAQDTIAKVNAQISAFIQKNSKMGRQFRAEFENLKIKFDTETSVQGVRDIVAEFNALKQRVYEANLVGKSFFANLGNRIKQMSTNFLAMYASLYDIVRYIRTMFTTINALDTALVDLKKTTTMTNAQLEEFYYNSSNIAKQTGATTQEIISQAAAWSRLGYSTQEAATEMAALSSQFAAISPGMSLDNATDDLVSTMQAFHIEVDDTERDIMDNVNRIGNTFATSNQEIGEMLKRSSAAMNAANNSLEETIALESAAVQITRNAETTGTAFRTISMRIRGKQSLPPYTVMYMLCA